MNAARPSLEDAVPTFPDPETSDPEIVDVAIVGAGPYGLSIAAHLRRTHVSFRIFGSPMQSWRRHMPRRMMLKSEGFASSLFDPENSFTLKHFCEQHSLPYSDVGTPVPCETFVAYGMEFQRRLVPSLEETDITLIKQTPQGFELCTADGRCVPARAVVIASGISNFAHLPAELAALPDTFVTHSSRHHDLTRFAGQHVAVLGAGASAVDLAAILADHGAHVELIARRPQIAFHSQGREPRPLWEKVSAPRSGLGVGWRSKLCTDAPLLFHSMPPAVRLRAVRRHLGPAPGWFVRDKVEGKVPMHLGSHLREASVTDGKLWLDLCGPDGQSSQLTVDHLIAATGFRVSLSRLPFLDDALRARIRTLEDAPVLAKNFASSVPSLYFVGLASANSFGPLTRFAYGAGFTAKHLASHLAAQHATAAARRPVIHGLWN